MLSQSKVSSSPGTYLPESPCQLTSKTKSTINMRFTLGEKKIKLTKRSGLIRSYSKRRLLLKLMRLNTLDIREIMP